MSGELYHVKLVQEAVSKDWFDYARQTVEIAAPILTIAFGFAILRITKRLEGRQWRNQKLIEKRVDEWNDVREGVNDIYCYCLRVGNWKEVNPKSIVDLKRTVDRRMYLAQPYFSAELHAAYQRFIHCCFATFQGHAVNAKIKSNLQLHKTGYTQLWDNAWDDYFSDQPSSEDSIKESYQDLIGKVSADISLQR